MAAQLAVALLALASLAAASDLNCEELVKPLVLDSHSPVSTTAFSRPSAAPTQAGSILFFGFFSLSSSDLWEVGAPRGGMGQARPEE